MSKKRLASKSARALPASGALAISTRPSPIDLGHRGPPNQVGSSPVEGRTRNRGRAPKNNISVDENISFPVLVVRSRQKNPCFSHAACLMHPQDPLGQWLAFRTPAPLLGPAPTSSSSPTAAAALCTIAVASARCTSMVQTRTIAVAFHAPGPLLGAPTSSTATMAAALCVTANDLGT